MFNIATVTDLWAKQEGFKSTFLPSTTSTNDYAKENLFSNQTLAIIVTEKQTKGRGRGKNTWTSPENGHALLCSITFKLESPPQSIASPCFGWAVYKALQESFNLDSNVKAPNDLYINDSKVGGILLESVSQGDSHHLILGLGINVFSHPNVDSSNSIINYIENSDLEENQWEQFLSHLISLSSQATIAAQEPMISEVITSELEIALKKHPNNKIKTLLPDGSLELIDGTFTDWKNL